MQRAFLALPDAFVSPRMWIQHSALLEEVLNEDLSGDSSDISVQQSASCLRETFDERLSDVRRRNEAMLFRHLPPRVLGALSSALSDIKVCIYLTDVTFAGVLTDRGMCSC